MHSVFRVCRGVIPAAMLVASLLPGQAWAGIPVDEQPVFDNPPTPTNGADLNVPAGQTRTITVRGRDTGGAPNQVTITVSNVTSPNGIVTLGADQDPASNVDERSFSYTPSDADIGTVQTFDFRISDGNQTNTTRVNFQVGARVDPDERPVFDRPPTPADMTVINTTVGQTVAFPVRGRDTGGPPNQVTTGLQIVTSPNGVVTFSADQNPADNVDERSFSFTPVEADFGTQQIFDFRVTDGNSASMTRVFVRVVAPQPTTVVVTRTPTGQAAFGQQICQTAVVTDQNGQPLAGVPVTFTISGNTGNNGTTQDGGVSGPVVTNEQGIAQFCFTPLFPGTNTVTIGVPGLANQTNTVVTGIPASTPGANVTGNGVVNTAPAGAQGPIPGFFSLSARGRGNGTARGDVNFVVPATGTGGIFRLNGIRIFAVTVQDNPGNRSAIIFGTARTNTFGRVAFRIDVVDGGFPGVPNDSFRITIIQGPNSPGSPGGVVGPVGGNLSFTRTPDLTRSHDIRIQLGAAAQ